MIRGCTPPYDFIGQAVNLAMMLNVLEFYGDPTSWADTGTSTSRACKDAGSMARAGLGVVDWGGLPTNNEVAASSLDHWVWMLRATADMLEFTAGGHLKDLGAEGLRSMADSAEAALVSGRTNADRGETRTDPSGCRRFPDTIEPDDGYPSEGKLREIRDANDVAGAATWLFETFPRLVHSLPLGGCEITDGETDLGTPVRRLHFWTNGWSGQESLIAAVEFGLPGRLFMESWRRGGEYVFEARTSLLRARECDAGARAHATEGSEG